MIKNTWNRVRRSVLEFDYSTLKNIGIGKTMLLYFLTISLIPLATLSFINFLYYYRGLNIMAKKSLFTSSQLRVNYLNSYFQDLESYLADLSTDKSNVFILSKISNTDAAIRFKKAKSNIPELENHFRSEIQKSWIPDGIQNLFFISSKGEIVFELNGNADLGKNLFNSDLSATKFARMSKKILKEEKPMFSDLEVYPPGNKEIYGFMGYPVVGNEGEKIGILALQISTEKIDKIIQYGVGFGNTGHVYLIGTDLCLRANSKISSGKPVLKQFEMNEKTKTWQDVKVNNLTLKSNGDPITEEVSIYQTGKGKWVIGVYRNIDIAEKLGVNWALVEEIDQVEAHAVARELSSFAKLSLIITTIVVIILSILVTRRFVNPLKILSEWAKQVGSGQLIIRDVKVPRDEVGEMKDQFIRLVISLKSMADVSQAVALGDYSKSVAIRSEDDILGKSMNQMVESFKNVVKQARAIAEGDYSSNIIPRSDQDTLGISLFEMTNKLREASIEIAYQDWLKTGLNELGTKISGEKKIKDLCDEVVSFLSHYLDAQIGLLYTLEEDHLLHLTASYAFNGEDASPEPLAIGQGLVGQVAKERKKLAFFSSSDDLPAVHIGLDQVQPRYFILSPVLFENNLAGVIELGSFRPFDEQKQKFLETSLENIAVALNTARSRERVEKLLLKTQEQTNELANQKEELRQINQELEEQTRALRMSEENLQHQQEELRVINEELEERTKVLELQRDDIRKKNEALEMAQEEIRQKAEALEIASRYKSEFLANMSHELRTPLNSIMVLSEILSANKKGAMTPDEVEFARIIHSSGNDLLELINDILDLSKVEAGKMEIEIEQVSPEDIQDYVVRTFTPFTQAKNIELKTQLDKDIPDLIETDLQRLLQIIKNLMSNAIKFTEKGSVTFRISKPDAGVRFNNLSLSAGKSIAIIVTDTGVGIPEDKKHAIFEAFQQADGTVNRKFGGTGLGLTISRSLARLLGGELQLKSKSGEGSTFTIYIPLVFQIIPSGSEEETGNVQKIHRKSPSSMKETALAEEDPNPETSVSLSDSAFKGKKILVVDDDMRNVYVLTKILEEKNVQVVIGRTGKQGLEKLHENPDINLVIMDIMMPEMDGYAAMREIRKDARFTSLPVIALTAKAMKGDREKCIEAGANDYLSKPVKTEKLLSLLKVWLQK
jgi:signal transduction histidine kinase/methyl-accepting chemotaxis protein